MGRKRSLDRDALMAKVCERIATGELVKDAAEAEGVDARRIREWALAPEYAPLYARARESQAHAWAERALAVANGDDALTQAREEAIEEAESALIAAGDSQWSQKVKALQNNLIQRDKLRVDTLKWMASKLAPRHYGDKLDVTSADKPLSGVVLLPAVQS